MFVCFLLGFLQKRWGHRSTSIGDYQLLVSGGTSGEIVESVDVIHNVNNLCSLATTVSQCFSLSECFACGNTTANTLVSCFVATNFSEDVCMELGGEHVENSFHSDLSCGSFTDCKECLISDVSRALNCTWCLCDNVTTCTLPSDCLCTSEDFRTPEVCVLDVCKYSACDLCLSDTSCAWLGASLTMDEVRHDLLNVSSTFVEWGCYSSSINEIIIESDRNFSLKVCPKSCNTLTSCDECVSSNSSHGGSLKCIWASYSGECMSEDSIPLLCATGICGSIITSSDQCRPACSQKRSCNECQMSPECIWVPASNNQQGMCFNIADVQGSSVEKLVKCFDCHEDCEKYGWCLYTGECLCEFGFVGVACNVTCNCNGFSNCANDTIAGRSTCLNCVNNTMVSQFENVYVVRVVHSGACSNYRSQQNA